MKKSRQGEIEKMWVQEGEEHAKRVAEWADECVWLKAEGVRAKDMPKKPSKRRKQDVVDAYTAANASREVEGVSIDADEVEMDSESDTEGV